MPNWCVNTLKISHEDPKMIDRVEKSLKEERFLEEFIPNPDPENWYNHNVENWGTKWDVGSGEGVREGNLFSVTFDSAWSPPIEGYRKLTGMGFEIEAYYLEEGMCFVGKYTSEDDEESYTYENDADWVRENIPEDIDEEFSLSERIEEQDWDDVVPFDEED